MTRPAWFWALPALALFAVFVLYPLVNVIRYAGWEWSGLSDPEFIGFANIPRLFRDPDLWRSFRTTAFFALLMLPSFLWLSRTIALAIEGVRLERFIKALLFLPGLMTIAGSVIAWNLLYEPSYGLVRELTGLYLPWDFEPWAALVFVVLFTLWQYVGYGVLIVSAALRGIPKGVKEAAKVDGATTAQIQRFIVSPLLRPTMVFLTVIGSVAAIQSYTAVFLLTRGGPFGSTRVIGYYLYETAFERLQLGYGAALTLFMLIITLAVAGVQAVVLSRRQ